MAMSTEWEDVGVLGVTAEGLGGLEGDVGVGESAELREEEEAKVDRRGRRRAEGVEGARGRWREEVEEEGDMAEGNTTGVTFDVGRKRPDLGGHAKY